MTSNAVEESKPVVGSSKNSKFGLLTNSIPIFTLFFSPPEIPLILILSPITVSAALSRFKQAIISSAFNYGSEIPLRLA